MANHLEQTWIAYAFDQPAAAEDIDERSARVRRHTQKLFAEEIVEERAAGACLGLGLWRRPDPRLRASLFTESAELAAATTSAITGSRNVLGTVNAPLQAIAASLLDNPEGAVRLNPPFVAGAISGARDRLVIVNDAIGAARLFELEVPGGRVWS